MAEHDQVIIDIVDYVYDYEIQNASSYTRARELFLDTLGCAIEGIANPDVRAFVGPVIPGSIFPGGSRLPGTSIRQDPVKAAFDFGSMIRYLDHNDGLIGAEWGHPSDNLGAILPVMDWLAQSRLKEEKGRENGDDQVQQKNGQVNGQVSGQGNVQGVGKNSQPEMTIKTLLTAMIKAYEIQGCFQIANSFNALGFDHTLLIKIASAPVLAWLMGLSRQQALSALSQAWMDGHALRTYRATVNTCSRKGWAAGDSCMRAVHLVMLIRAGQGGAPKPLTEPTWGFYARIFRGKEFIFPQPYGETVLFRTLVKLIPCEGHALTAAEAALEVSQRLRERRIRDVLDEVAGVEIRTHKPAMTIIDKRGPLKNAADRDHCMQYIVAVVLLKGAMIESVDYFDEGPFVRDPRVDELRGRISMKEDQALTRDYYEKLGENHLANGITVTLKDGTRLPEVFVRHPIGCVLSKSDGVPGMDIMSKFRRNMSRMFPAEQIAKLETALLDDDLRVDKFVDLCVRQV